MRERPLQVVERGQHFRDDALPGPLDGVFLLARYALAVVVELRLQPLRGLQVPSGLFARGLELTLQLIASELELSAEVLCKRGVGRSGRARGSPEGGLRGVLFARTATGGATPGRVLVSPRSHGYSSPSTTS